MIQANELRIGNLLNYQTAEGDVVTLTTDFHAIQWATEDPKGFNLVHTPIPLTEKWLVKFGFEVKFGKYRKLPFQLGIKHSVGFYVDYMLEELKYVHQLQNLYFAITGQELTPLH